jgi:hypothetical protein
VRRQQALYIITFKSAGTSNQQDFEPGFTVAKYSTKTINLEQASSLPVNSSF